MSTLELQREILAAVEAKDEDALEAIAVREGIDVNLWRYSRRMSDAMQEIGKVEAAFADALKKAVEKVGE